MSLEKQAMIIDQVTLKNSGEILAFTGGSSGEFIWNKGIELYYGSYSGMGKFITDAEFKVEKILTFKTAEEAKAKAEEIAGTEPLKDLLSRNIGQSDFRNLDKEVKEQNKAKPEPTAPAKAELPKVTPQESIVVKPSEQIISKPENKTIEDAKKEFVNNPGETVKKETPIIENKVKEVEKENIPTKPEELEKKETSLKSPIIKQSDVTPEQPLETPSDAPVAQDNERVNPYKGESDIKLLIEKAKEGDLDALLELDSRGRIEKPVEDMEISKQESYGSLKLSADLRAGDLVKWVANDNKEKDGFIDAIDKPRSMAVVMSGDYETRQEVPLSKLKKVKEEKNPKLSNIKEYASPTCTCSECGEIDDKKPGDKCFAKVCPSCGKPKMLISGSIETDPKELDSINGFIEDMEPVIGKVVDFDWNGDILVLSLNDNKSESYTRKDLENAGVL